MEKQTKNDIKKTSTDLRIAALKDEVTENIINS